MPTSLAARPASVNGTVTIRRRLRSPWVPAVEMPRRTGAACPVARDLVPASRTLLQDRPTAVKEIGHQTRKTREENEYEPMRRQSPGGSGDAGDSSKRPGPRRALNFLSGGSHVPNELVRQAWGSACEPSMVLGCDSHDRWSCLLGQSGKIRTGVRLARTGTGVRLGICTLFVAWASRKAAVRGSFFHFETVLS